MVVAPGYLHPSPILLGFDGDLLTEVTGNHQSLTGYPFYTPLTNVVRDPVAGNHPKVTAPAATPSDDR